MKPYNFSPERKKLYLRTLLLGALGFSLSMSPEQFNNIVRNDGNSGVFEMALTSEEAEARRMEMARDNVKSKNSTAATRNLLGQAPTKDKKTETTPMTDDQKEAQRMKEAQASAAASAERMNSGTTRSLLPAKGQSQKSAGQQSMTSEDGVRRMSYEELEKIVGNLVKQANADLVGETTNALIDRLRKEGIIRAESIDAKLPLGAQTATTAGASTAPVPGTPVPGTARPEVGNANSGGTTTVATTAAATPAPIYRDVVLSNKDLCRAYFSKENDSVVAKVEKVTEAVPCGSQGSHKLKGPIGDLAELEKELRAQIDKADTQVAKADKDKEAQKEKIEKLKEKYEGLVKLNCNKKGLDYTEKLECVQNLAAGLSDQLDDSNASKSLMRTFLGKYVIPRIKEGMVAQTVTVDAFGRPVDNIENQQKLTAANDASLYLLEHLNSDNSDSWIVQQLGQARNAGYNAQIGFAKNMYLQAQEDKKDPLRFQLGVYKENVAKMNLNTFSLNGTLGRDRMDWSNALSTGDKSQYLNSLAASLFTPAQTLIGKLPKWDLYGKLDANKQDMAAVALSNLAIDSFGFGNGSLPYTGGTLITGLPEGLTFESRLKQQADPRVNGIADIMTRGSKVTNTTGTAATVKTRTGRGAGLLN